MAKKNKFRQFKTESGTSNQYLTKLGRTGKLGAFPRTITVISDDVTTSSILGDVFAIAKNLKSIFTSKD